MLIPPLIAKTKVQKCSAEHGVPSFLFEFLWKAKHAVYGFKESLGLSQAELISNVVALRLTSAS